MTTENQGATNNKRKRRYLPHNRPVRKKGPSPLRPGIIGFFITCDGGRERDAAQEALNVIDSFFEELIDGEDSNVGVAAKPGKPLNKKITFTYSESSDSEEDSDDGDDKEAEENHSEKPAEETAEKKIPDEVKSDNGKGEEESHEAPSGEIADNNKEVVEPQVHKDSEDNEEPLQKKQCSDATKLETVNQGPGTSEMSVDKLIEAEIKELADKGKRRFARLDTGCNGVVFILMRRRVGDPGPGEIVQHMMEKAARTKKHMSRFLLRVLPVELSCYASGEEISKAIKPIVEKHFPADTEAPAKFAVQYDARANSGIERMKIIDAVAQSVPAPHKVDLKNPEKTIIVQIIKTVCLIGVVEKYKELAKYNLRQLTSPSPQ